MDGWIKIHRRLLDWEWYDDNNVVRVFLHLLLTANYEPKKWHGQTIERGTLITGRIALAQETNLSEQQVRTALKKLESTGEITTKSTNQFTIITICNYERYQTTETAEQPTNQPANNQQITNEQPTDNQRITTTKEIKKDKKERTEENIFAQAVDELQPEIKESIMACANEIECWIDYKKNEFRAKYKTAISFKAFLNKLYNLGNGNPEIMKAIIEQSIANHYQGIFELKNKKYGDTRNDTSSCDYVSTDRIVAAGFAMAKAGI